MVLFEIAVILFIVFFSVIIHEYSHGMAAYLNGDDTARVMGRLTLNPLPHIDPLWTIGLPLLLVLTRSPIVFGMAKPVPINPYRFRDFDRGLLQVGAAGPLSNILLGTVFSLLYGIVGIESGIGEFLAFGGFINFILAFFNLIPIPPLDGSRIVSVFLPPGIRARYEGLERGGIIIVMVLLLSGLFRFVAWAAQAMVILVSRTPFTGF